jgi:hypothetical protein
MNTGRVISTMIIASIFIGCLSAPLAAQDFGELLKKMQQQYKKATNLEITMAVAAYESINDERPFFTEHISVFKKDDNYLMISNDYELLYNDKYSINMNRQFRQLHCQRRDKAKEREFQTDALTDLDSLLSLFHAPKLMGENNGIVQFRVTQSGGHIVYTDLFIDTEAMKMTEIRYHYNPEIYEGDRYATIKFETFEIQQNMDQSRFSERPYIKVNKDGKILPADAFADFQFISDQN